MSRRNDLVALVGSRICHDLVSPMGAIGNGVELLELTGGPSGPEMALISESVAAANARIRFFRIAYGNAGEDASIGRAEIAGTLAATARGGRLSYYWQAEGAQSRREVRAAFLMLQCFETALPHGGDIHIDRSPDQAGTAGRWRLVAEGARMQIDEALWRGLTQPRLRPAVTPAQVQFALLPDVLDDLGRTLTLDLGPGKVVAQF